jgi:AcrR family transcriptional regulator
MSRRAQIIAVATKLFRERGFHAVGIDEIGTAAGISGPGVYRHFASKDDLLVSVFEDATDDLWSDLDPDEHPSVEAYVRSHVAYALAHAEAIELWYQEGRHLPKDARRAQRRLQRRYVERWVEALRERRPELEEAEARVVVQAVIGLIHSTAHSERAVDDVELGPVLERLAVAALLA